jgi:hypothetical protein
MLFEIHRWFHGGVIVIRSRRWKVTLTPASALPGTPRPMRITWPARVRRHDGRRPRRRPIGLEEAGRREASLRAAGLLEATGEAG